MIKDGTVYVSALCPLQTLEESYDVCVARVRELQSRLLSATGSVVRTVRDFDGPPSNGEGKSNFGREGYHGHVSFLKQRIVAGDMVQTVPSHRLEVDQRKQKSVLQRKKTHFSFQGCHSCTSCQCLEGDACQSVSLQLRC